MQESHFMVLSPIIRFLCTSLLRLLNAIAKNCRAETGMESVLHIMGVLNLSVGYHALDDLYRA